MSLPEIQSQSRPALLEQIQTWEQPAYRVDQLLGWIHGRRVRDWESMSNLPKPLRRRLRETYRFEALECVRYFGSPDATQKFLWRLSDGALIESVLIPANPALYGESSDRHTLCLSSQVGCAYGCRFCASGLAGWKRHLSAAEIVEQVLAVERWQAAHFGEEGAPAGAGQRERWIDNLVVMGMGEPLANYEAVLQALRILNAPWGGNIGARKMTLSTSGLAPQIRRLALEPEQFRLAISLHGATDAVRNRLMPINRKYPLAELVAAGEAYVAAKGRGLTLEYILISDLNDRIPRDSGPLVQLARRLRAKINLIPYNQVDGLTWRRPAAEVQEAFLRALLDQGAAATLRREKGHDIEAACGQLRLRTLEEGGSERLAPLRPNELTEPIGAGRRGHGLD